MTTRSYPNARPNLGWLETFVWMFVAATSFHAAMKWSVGWLSIATVYALIELSRQPSKRKATYVLLATGFLFYAPQLGFFWGIFGPGAVALWYVLSFWVALFGLMLYLIRNRFGEVWTLALAPIIWTGLEYFRGELYYLRFTWLTLGMAHSVAPAIAHGLGIYLLGFAAMVSAVAVQAIRGFGRCAAAGALVVLVCVASFVSPATVFHDEIDRPSVSVAGVQLEFQTEHNILRSLDQLLVKFPDAQLLMLSEYTFDGPVPEKIRAWCRDHKRYLVAGGKEPLGKTNFYNTAYVVGPDGEIVHHQVKSVPIQFFKDGLPAPERKVWQSPWGPLGILICYDLSYTRVVDDFVRQGARALLAPTMDVADWGRHQHELHGRIAPLRAAEYGIPIFRVCSSGISQLVNDQGAILASASFPGEGAMLGGKLPMDAQPHLPLDRFLAPTCTVATALLGAWLAFDACCQRRSRSEFVSGKTATT